MDLHMDFRYLLVFYLYRNCINSLVMQVIKRLLRVNLRITSNMAENNWKLSFNPILYANRFGDSSILYLNISFSSLSNKF